MSAKAQAKAQANNILRSSVQNIQQPDAQSRLSVVSTSDPAPTSPPTAKAPVPRSRIGKCSISVHVALEVQEQLGMMAVRKHRSRESLVVEALNDLFRKYNNPAIAE